MVKTPIINGLHPYYLQTMGVETWLLREPSCPSINLSELAIEVSKCTRCPLHQSRTHTVFARGDAKANLMIIGEAPGSHEDKLGQAFVGKAGELLDKMLISIGLTEDHFYLTNVLKCRPPNNRDPEREEIECCQEYLVQQIRAVAPRLILALGRVAGQFLIGGVFPLHQMRNITHHYHGTPVIVTYHPAYLLRNPIDKKEAYLDLLRTQMLLKE